MRTGHVLCWYSRARTTWVAQITTSRSRPEMQVPVPHAELLVSASLELKDTSGRRALKRNEGIAG